MADRLTTEILINLAGNLTAKARQYGANMSEFARTNERAMSVVRASTAAAGRGLDALGNRYTGMIAGFAGGAMLKNFAATDRRLTRLGISAGKTKDEIKSIFGDVQDIAIKYRIDNKELVSFLETINAMTGDIKFGTKNLIPAAATIAGTGSSGESIGALFAQFQKYGINNDKDASLAMDVLNRLGKEGAYELKDLADKAGPALSLYAAAGGRGVKGIKDVGVLLESAIDTTSNRDTAATLVEGFIREIQNPKIAKELRKRGVSTTDKNGSLKALPDLLLELSQGSARGAERSRKAGNKDASAQGELQAVGFTQVSLDLIAGASGQKGQENLKRYNAVIADGKSIQEDATYVAQDFTSAVQSLDTTWEKFANKELAKPVQELADALNSVDKDTVNNWLEIGKNIAIATGGIIAARKVFQVGKGAWDLFGGGKSKGIPKGVADVFGSGVMPVYVVNMGAGGLGGGPDIIPTGTPQGNWFSRYLPILKTTAMGATLPFLDASPNLTDDQKAEMVQWAQNRANGPSVWSQIADFFTSASSDPQVIDPRPWVSPQQFSQYPLVPPQLRGEIRVVVEGDARVKSVSTNQPGVTLSASAGTTGAGQN